MKLSKLNISYICVCLINLTQKHQEIEFLSYISEDENHGYSENVKDLEQIE